MPTTSYGTWTNYTDGSSTTVQGSVAEVLGPYLDDYDVDGLTDAYREAINDLLPEGVSLNGDDFYGPYPKAEGVDEMIRGAIGDVDLDGMLEEYVIDEDDDGECMPRNITPEHLPPWTDDPIDRLRHVLGAFDRSPDDGVAILATAGIPGLPAHTGLTWGDLRAILALLDDGVVEAEDADEDPDSFCEDCDHFHAPCGDYRCCIN